MAANIDVIALAIGSSAIPITGFQPYGTSSVNSSSDQSVPSLLSDLQSNSQNTSSIPSNQPDYNSQIARLNKMDADLIQLNNHLNVFQRISPSVLVDPFTAVTYDTLPQKITPLDFFTPDVIALLLQHVAITIAALSIIRESRFGAMELFRISPISSMETILGKYISYIVFGVIIGTIITLLVYFGLHTPMLGSWIDYALVSLAVIFTSLGIGFVISLISQTESQAVQFAMITLLLSVFFSGFFINLIYFYPPIKIVSYLLPVTYAISLLQGVMLRGETMNPFLIAGLTAYGIILFVASWWLMRRKMIRSMS